MKIAIVGSRPMFLANPELVETMVRAYVEQLPKDTIIISGQAEGVDTWAEQAAKELGYTFIPFKAQWKTYGKSAGFRRNAEMVNEANKVVAFWNGHSRGTEHTINMARREQKLERVFLVEPATAESIKLREAQARAKNLPTTRRRVPITEQLPF